MFWGKAPDCRRKQPNWHEKKNKLRIKNFPKNRTASENGK